MSYRALLFCPDEAAARLVTQVLSELEFTVELSFEPFVTVQKLTTESFDAVVVDCTNEENASLLFKGARNSSLNHSSLCVAVVEGQMGVAKAFRIGANLVLTKPINIEQSKGTLRVARGLLRKSDNKPHPTPGTGGPSTIPVANSIIAAQPAPKAPGMPVAAASSEPPASARPAAAVPTSLFEAQQAAASADETKIREKSPTFLVQKSPAAELSSSPVSQSRPERFAGGIPMGAAAAPAMAPEKPTPSPISTTPSELETQSLPRIKTAAPLATQEAIVPEMRFPEPEVAPVPTFSSYAQQASASSGSGTKIIWAIIVLLVLGPAGYFGWRKLQPLRYIHRAPAIGAQPTSVPSQPAVVADTVPAKPSPAVEPQAGVVSVPATDTANNSGAPIVANGAPEGFPTKETIEVDQPADKPEPAITVVPKPEPLQVKQKPVEPVEAEPTPPSVVLPESKATDSTLAGLVTTNVAVPKPVPGALQVSEGVTQGLLIKKIAPLYPATALKLRKQGAVELLATVSKTGTIAKVRVLSGESILAQAAVDAVRQWKYRPFLLNAEPVEIQTQITINFKLPN
jgi:protein TonB